MSANPLNSFFGVCIFDVGRGGRNVYCRSWERKEPMEKVRLGQGVKSPLVDQAAPASFSFPTMESLSQAPTWRKTSLPPLSKKIKVGMS